MPAGEPRIEYLGNEGAPLVILDEVARNPEWFVDFVGKNCSFGPPTDGDYYPGVRAFVPEEVVRKLYYGIDGLLCDFFQMQGLRLKYAVAYFSLLTTPHDKLAVNQCVPHYDSTNIRQLALLHYFCPEGRGGTSFYRHRSTGYESITPDRQEDFVEKIDAETRAAPPVRGYIEGDTALFQRIGSVDAVFNRLAVYPSICLHSTSVPRDFTFEQDVRVGRLTLNTMMEFG